MHWLLDIPNYEGLYTITKEGSIWGHKRKTWLKPTLQQTGYMSVMLFKEGKQKRFLVHRLIMLAHVGPSDNDVNHINAIKTDNRLENLEYCTHKENMRHAFKLGLMNTACGEKQGNAKLTEKQAKHIKYSDIKAKELCELYQIRPQTVSLIRLGKNWKHI